MSDEMDEIWALYADDGAQALDAMETALLALSSGATEGKTDHVAALFRAVHTFKGNSRVLGLSVVESRAHLAEDLIGLVRDEGVPLDDEICEILLLAADTLRDMLEKTAATRADVSPDGSEDLMRQLADKIARCSGKAPDHAPAAAAVVEPVVEAEPVAAGVAAPAEIADAAPEAEPEDAFPELARSAEPDEDFDIANFPLDETYVEPDPVAVTPVASQRRLADDPVYRNIFTGMAQDTLGRLHTALEGENGSPESFAPLRADVDGLAHAARQMGLPDWAAALEAYLGRATVGPEVVAQLVLDLNDLMARDFGGNAKPEATEAESLDFFSALREPLSVIAGFGMDFSTGATPDRARLATQVEAIRKAATPHNFVRVIEAASDLDAANSSSAYRRAELRLYEELAAVEAVMIDAARSSGISPRDLLADWCADHIFDTLAELDVVVNALRSEEKRDPLFRQFSQLMRLVHHACRHHHIETAAQLAMSLIDLFSRQQATGAAPDAILSHIARGFIDTIELVFDSVNEGETPHTAMLDKLFEEAANAAFTADGVITASAIERRLGLPPEFHRVLSPDSVRSASQALDDGLSFYILRADINDNETLAEAFLTWISSGELCAITNVTVFRDNATLFDFLVATKLDEPAMAEAVANLDASGKHLVVLRALDTGSEEAATDEAPATAGEPAQQQVAGISAEMLESIGEISAGQAMIHHMLTELTETDLAEGLDSILRASGNDMDRARTDLRAMLADFSHRLRDMAQLEAQLVAQLAHLQEETVAIRSRSAETVLRPLATFAQTHARKSGRDARLTTAGGELSLDITLLDTLRKVLRSLVTLRLDLPQGAPVNMHVAFQRDEERVLVTVEDDGAAQPASPVLEALTQSLQRANGDLRQVQRPGGGQRYHITVPLTMVVLEGMVVGVDGVRYVLPVDSIRTILQPESDVLITIAADRGRQMIKLSKDEIISVHALSDGGKFIDRNEGKRPVFVVLNARGQSIAVPVDELVGQQLVLLRPLRGVMTRMQNLTGIALLAGGDVGMVLSPGALCGGDEVGGRVLARA